MHHRPRSNRANGLAIRRYRMARGWTQADLAASSGYSPRLIRKAESSGLVDIETLKNIAEALSSKDQVVSFQDISVNILTMAKEWMECLNEKSDRLGDHTAHLLSHDFMLRCPGLPDTAPFIGDWHGVDGLNRFWQIYNSVFKRSPHQDVTFALAKDLVIARFLESGHIEDQHCGPIRVHMVFHFRESKIYRIDDDYDLYGAIVAKQRAERVLEDRKERVSAFLQCYESYDGKDLSALRETTIEDFEFHLIAEHPLLAPLRGIWKGTDGFISFLDQFFGAFTRTGSLATTLSTADNCVDANFVDEFTCGSDSLGSFNVSLRFHFRELAICKVELVSMTVHKPVQSDLCVVATETVPK